MYSQVENIRYIGSHHHTHTPWLLFSLSKFKIWNGLNIKRKGLEIKNTANSVNFSLSKNLMGKQFCFDLLNPESRCYHQNLDLYNFSIWNRQSLTDSSKRKNRPSEEYFTIFFNFIWSDLIRFLQQSQSEASCISHEFWWKVSVHLKAKSLKKDVARIFLKSVKLEKRC